MSRSGKKLRRAIRDIRAALSWDSTMLLWELVQIANEDGVAVVLHADGRTELVLLRRAIVEAQDGTPIS